jgi:hypothetical protein
MSTNLAVLALLSIGIGIGRSGARMMDSGKPAVSGTVPAAG